MQAYFNSYGAFSGLVHLRDIRFLNMVRIALALAKAGFLLMKSVEYCFDGSHKYFLNVPAVTATVSANNDANGKMTKVGCRLNGKAR